MNNDQAKQVPLVELLDEVPADVRIGVQDDEGWQSGTTWHPVGQLCHEAAAELRRLHELHVLYQDKVQRLEDAVKLERDRVWTQAHWTEYERSIAAAERKRLHDKFMEIHKSQQHSNNYWHFAARKIMEEPDAA
jgi:hypothetical protein